MVACSQSGIHEEVSPTPASEQLTRSAQNVTDTLNDPFTFEEDRALLNALGYDTSYMVESDERYFVGTEYLHESHAYGISTDPTT